MYNNVKVELVEEKQGLEEKTEQAKNIQAETAKLRREQQAHEKNMTKQTSLIEKKVGSSNQVTPLRAFSCCVVLFQVDQFTHVYDYFFFICLFFFSLCFVIICLTSHGTLLTSNLKLFL